MTDQSHLWQETQLQDLLAASSRPQQRQTADQSCSQSSRGERSPPYFFSRTERCLEYLFRDSRFMLRGQFPIGHVVCSAVTSCSLEPALLQLWVSVRTVTKAFHVPGFPWGHPRSWLKVVELRSPQAGLGPQAHPPQVPVGPGLNPGPRHSEGQPLTKDSPRFGTLKHTEQAWPRGSWMVLINRAFFPPFLLEEGPGIPVDVPHHAWTRGTGCPDLQSPL